MTNAANHAHGFHIMNVYHIGQTMNHSLIYVIYISLLLNSLLSFFILIFWVFLPVYEQVDNGIFFSLLIVFERNFTKCGVNLWEWLITSEMMYCRHTRLSNEPSKAPFAAMKEEMIPSEDLIIHKSTCLTMIKTYSIQQLFLDEFALFELTCHLYMAFETYLSYQSMNSMKSYFSFS